MFSLGKAYEDIGDYEKSYKYYDLGNNLNRGRTSYDPKAIEALTDRLISFFNKDLLHQFEDSGYQTNEPIFIVGLPRSGSTLVEQILASHSLVKELWNFQIL